MNLKFIEPSPVRIIMASIAIFLALLANASRGVYLPDQDTPVLKISFSMSGAAIARDQATLTLFSTQQDDLFDYAFIQLDQKTVRYEVAKHEIGEYSESVELIRMADESSAQNLEFTPRKIFLKVPLRDPESMNRAPATVTLVNSNAENSQRKGRVEAAAEFR